MQHTSSATINISEIKTSANVKVNKFEVSFEDISDRALHNKGARIGRNHGMKNATHLKLLARLKKKAENKK